MMKRNRNEHVMTVVGQYLKKRQYMDADVYKKNDLKLQQSLQEMAIRGSISNESSIGNVVAFSSLTTDATAFDEQLTRLISFVSEAPEPYKSELSFLLCPIFIHIYLELVLNGPQSTARTFCLKHQDLFLDVPEYKSIFENLIHVTSSQDLTKYPNIKALRESKFMVKLSDSAIDYLLGYLKRDNHLILLQILNLHIEMKAQDPSKVNLYLYEDRKPELNKDNKDVAKATDAKLESAEAELKALQDVIRKVHEGPPSLPSICLYSFINLSQSLSSASLSNDISLLAGGFSDSAIRLWSLIPAPLLSTVPPSRASSLSLACDYDILNEDGSGQTEIIIAKPTETKTLRAHAGPVYGLSFVPQSSLLLSCSEDTTVRAWSMDSYSNVAVYRGHNYPVWDIDCSHSGLYFATASYDRTARLWYPDRTYPLRIFAGHSLDVDCVKFHPNGNYLATGSRDKSVRLWNIQDGSLVRMFQGHRGTVFSLAFSPNGQLLASAEPPVGEDRRIRIWDLAAGSLMKELRGHVDTVYSLCFSRDSSALASGGLDGTVRIWDVRKGFSAGNPVDSHTSPELLGSFPAKSTGLQLLHYSFYNLLVAVGARTN